MTAPEPILVLQLRAEARALLYGTGEYFNIEAAMLPLREFAIASGILDELGADTTLAIIETPFGNVREHIE